MNLLLRATFSPAHPLARRDVPLAREGLLFSLSLGGVAGLSFPARVARAQKIIRLHPLPLFREQEDDQATLLLFLLDLTEISGLQRLIWNHLMKRHLHASLPFSVF